MTLVPTTRSPRVRTGPPRRARRPVLLTVLGLALALVGGLLTAGPASAAAYRYWGYYQLTDGAWGYSSDGPDKATPADGTVEGWRFAVADESDATRKPRLTATFDQVCGSTAAASGSKRVAVVIDYGRDVDGTGATPPAPVASCASVPTAATGAEVLAAVATVRNGDGGLLCGIDGYPASGCADAVATVSDAQKAADTPVTLAPSATPLATASATASETAGPVVAASPTSTPSSGVPVAVWVGIVVLLLGIAALVWSALRRRRQNA